jgi:hypothetical protein
MKQIKIVLGYGVLIMIVSVLIIAHPSTLKARELQMSSAPAGVKIAFRDKYGKQAANVVIVVQEPDGKQCKAQRQVIGDNMVYFLFPEQFSGYSKGMPLNKNGKYIWKCFLNGGVVAEGEFFYNSTNTEIELKCGYPQFK